MLPQKCAANSGVFAKKAINLSSTVGILNDATNCAVGTDDSSFIRRKGDRFLEGQFTCSCRTRTVNVSSKICLANFFRTFSTSHKHCVATVDAKKNYYNVLGVTPQCSGVKVKQAYYRLSKVYHPDVNKTEAAVKKFHEITEAYEVLSSPNLRHQYDAHRRGHGHGHGFHRGSFRPGPTNFAARGPHQQTNTDKYNYDAWLKGHYTENFQKRKEDIEEIRQFRERRKAFERELNHDVERKNWNKYNRSHYENEMKNVASTLKLGCSVLFVLSVLMAVLGPFRG